MKTKEKAVIMYVSFVLFLICATCAAWLLPQHCFFFSSNELHGLACDGMRDWKVDPCPICTDKAGATAASYILGLGIGFLLLPFIVFRLRELRGRPVQQTKLFD
jgi:hypothetical protein